MNQIDIIIARKKFQAIDQRCQEELAKIPDIPSDTDNILAARSMRRQSQINVGEFYDEERKELRQSLFGSNLVIYAVDYADPLEVLDWIEHFINKESVE